MRTKEFGVSLALAVLVVTTVAAQDIPSGSSSIPTPSDVARQTPAEGTSERPIRQVAEDFAKAYNAHDAAAIAALFTANAEIVGEDGKATMGREAIGRVFAEIFEAHPLTQTVVNVQSIRFVTPSVAIEDGTTTVTHAAGEAAEASRYTVVHVREGGKWQMASARDLPDEVASGEEELKQLDGLVGEWVDESPEALVKTIYRWTDNQRFLLSEFTVQVGGRSAMTGSQRIGWDPLAKKLRSWVFDSEGGFAEGVWTRDGKEWTVKLNGVTRDGKVGSATNVITLISKDRLSWQSRDRTVGSEKTPDLGPFPIVRKPPQPMTK